MQDFKKLDVWKKSHDFTLKAYKISSHFPKEEVFSITSQLRRASSSIPINIAEGFGRNSNAQIIQFLNISIGSAQEVEYLLILSKDLNYISVNDFSQLSTEIVIIKSMIFNLMKKVESKIADSVKSSKST